MQILAGNCNQLPGTASNPIPKWPDISGGGSRHPELPYPSPLGTARTHSGLRRKVPADFQTCHWAHGRKLHIWGTAPYSKVVLTSTHCYPPTHTIIQLKGSCFSGGKTVCLMAAASSCHCCTLWKKEKQFFWAQRGMLEDSHVLAAPAVPSRGEATCTRKTAAPL